MSSSFPPTRASCRAKFRLKTRLTRKLELNMPLVVSAAMDTVTEGAPRHRASPQEGGIGIVHKNMPPEANRRRRWRSVKRFESGVLRDPDDHRARK